MGLTAGDDFISYSLSFLSAVDWLKVLVLAKCKADKSEHHQDGSGHHHPMRILQFEEQAQHSSPSARTHALGETGEYPANHFAYLGVHPAVVTIFDSRPRLATASL